MSETWSNKRPHPSGYQSCLAPAPKLTIIEEGMPTPTVDMADYNSKAERGRDNSKRNKGAKTKNNPTKDSENAPTASNHPKTALKVGQEEVIERRMGSIEETLELILQKVSCLPTIQSDVKAISDELNEQKKSLQYVHDDVETLKTWLTEYEGRMVEMEKKLKTFEEDRRELKDLKNMYYT